MARRRGTGAHWRDGGSDEGENNDPCELFILHEGWVSDPFDLPLNGEQGLDTSQGDAQACRVNARGKAPRAPAVLMVTACSSPLSR